MSQPHHGPTLAARQMIMGTTHFPPGCVTVDWIFASVPVFLRDTWTPAGPSGCPLLRTCRGEEGWDPGQPRRAPLDRSRPCSPPGPTTPLRSRVLWKADWEDYSLSKEDWGAMRGNSDSKTIPCLTEPRTPSVTGAQLCYKVWRKNKYPRSHLWQTPPPQAGTKGPHSQRKWRSQRAMQRGTVRECSSQPRCWREGGENSPETLPLYRPPLALTRQQPLLS